MKEERTGRPASQEGLISELIELDLPGLSVAAQPSLQMAEEHRCERAGAPGARRARESGGGFAEQGVVRGAALWNLG